MFTTEIEIKKLSEVTSLIMGQSPPSDSYNDSGQGLPFFQGKTDFGEIHPIERMYCTNPKKIAINQDILISVRAPVGDVNIANQESCIGRGLAALRADTAVINYKYLYYYLRYKKDVIANMGTGSTFKAISKKDLENIEVVLFDLEVQRKIVDVLETAEQLIKDRKEQISGLSNLTKSVFLTLIKENESALRRIDFKEVIEDTKNGLSRRGNDPEGEIVLRLREVKKNIIEYSSGINRIKLNEKEKNNYELKQNDLLLVRVNGNPDYVGRCSLFNSIDEKVYYNDHLIRVRLKEDVDPIYLSYFLNSEFGSKEIKKNIKTSAGQYTISQDGIGKVNLLLPSLEVQQKFSNLFSEVMKERRTLEQSLEVFTELFNSLLQKSFKGKLIVHQ